jgi:ArsR family transcriptional regulator
MIWFPNGPNGLLKGAAQVSGGLRPRTAALAMAAPTPSTSWLVTRDEAWAQETTELLKALARADPSEHGLRALAAAAPVCICDFTTAFELSQPTISHHMARLKAAGLVESAKQGIWIYYRLRDDLAPGTRAVLETLLGPAPA